MYKYAAIAAIALIGSTEAITQKSVGLSQLHKEHAETDGKSAGKTGGKSAGKTGGKSTGKSVLAQLFKGKNTIKSTENSQGKTGGSSAKKTNGSSKANNFLSQLTNGDGDMIVEMFNATDAN